ncbi:methyl-accepting chemotaxis protein [Acinetobacter bereziniae]|uniref:methyl-accepting chemotaxis protein n=1 Tax=Acinetobacter bereziniae TaxID=106648 RepID=UPI00124F92AD|nr:methyl-accepting chemotaxis protein [Acinetobacter bereziniae]
MKFFKYLIFIVTSFVSFNSFAYYFAGHRDEVKTYGGETAEQACINYASARGVKFAWVDSGGCIDTQGSAYGFVERAENKCRYDNNFTWDSSNPPPKTPPSSVCYNQCNFSVTWASSAYDGGKKLSWYGVGKSTGSSCDANTDFGNGQGQTEGGNGSNGSNGSNGNCTTTNGTTTCTGGSGGQGGSGGGGGSGGAGGAGGNASITVDMQSVVNAITELSNNLATRFQDISVAITNMSAKITDAIGKTNELLFDIKNDQKTQTTELKNAINENGDKITGAIKQNTNAVESGSRNVKIAIEDNTTAVKNASAQNQTSLEAVKTAIENINASVSVIVQNQKENNEQSNASIEKTVSDNSDKIVGAINDNGDKVKKAVDLSTDETKKNGEKLDGIKEGVEDGNGILKGISDTITEIKDWLTKEPELQTGQLEINNEVLPGYERKDYVQFTNTCPFSAEEVNLPMGVLGSITFTKDLTFVCTYGVDARPYIIALGYFGALIYLLYGLRSRNG